MYNLIILSLFTIATINAEPVWETLALSDCNGGYSFLPSSPVSFKIRFHGFHGFHATKHNKVVPKLESKKYQNNVHFQQFASRKFTFH